MSNLVYTEITCEVCGELLPVPHPNKQKFHNGRCRKEAINKKKTEWQKTEYGKYTRNVLQRKRYNSLKKERLCVVCGNPVVETYTLCELHRQERLKRRFNSNNRLSSIKARAKELAVPFNLTSEDIAVPEYCPVLGFRLEFGSGRGQVYNSPSVDRLIPELGYVRGNVVVISWLANNIKRNFKAKDLEAVAKWMQSQGLE